MKKNWGIQKRLLALALAFSLLPTTIYATETTTTAVAEEETLPTLTLDEALAKAQKRSLSLSDVNKTTQYLQDSQESLWNSVGYFTLPNYDYKEWVNEYVQSYTSALFALNTQITQTKYSKAVTTLTLEMTLKTLFNTITEMEASYALASEQVRLQEVSYQQSVTKNKVGLLSDYNLKSEKTKLDTAKANLVSLKLNMDSIYLTFNDLIGEEEDARFTLIDPVEYEVYTLTGSMSSYVNAALKKDYTILLQELSLESAKFNMNFLPETSTSSQEKTLTYTYQSTQRSLKQAKQSKELAIRSAYVKLQTIQLSYEQALQDLEKAKTDYAVTELNFKVGNITQSTLDAAKLGVTSAELNVTSLAHSYDMQVFMFQNTTLLS